MTRQKRELIKKIDQIESYIQADSELGCGFAPAGFYDKAYQEIEELQEELAKLSHYNSAMEMMMDNRGCDNDFLPFA